MAVRVWYQYRICKTEIASAAVYAIEDLLAHFVRLNLDKLNSRVFWSTGVDAVLEITEP